MKLPVVNYISDNKLALEDAIVHILNQTPLVYKIVDIPDFDLVKLHDKITEVAANKFGKPCITMTYNQFEFTLNWGIAQHIERECNKYEVGQAVSYDLKPLAKAEEVWLSYKMDNPTGYHSDEAIKQLIEKLI